VIASQAYDGALGLGPGAESHGGSTYTGLAALSLMGGTSGLARRAECVHWCIARQIGGFQGRPNKDEDTCYSFWIGGALHLLGQGQLVDPKAVACFAQCCEGARGGVSKLPGAHPDILHSYFALAGLALTGHPGLRALDPRFGISERARKEAGLRPFAADDRRDGQSSDVVNVCEPCNDSDVPAPA